MVDWINNNSIEITGAVLAFIYLILEIKQKWTLWIASIISSIFYVYIFFDAKLYAETGMNIYYAVMAVYGLYCWKFSKAKKDENSEFHFASAKTIGQLLGFAIFFFIILLFVLIRYTDSPVPAPDALIASLSIVATWMVAKKIVECWHIWIFVNTFAIGLYIYQHLYPTAVLYVFYSILSVTGLIEWRKSVIKKNDSSVTKF